jgi:hypothetical protein
LKSDKKKLKNHLFENNQVKRMANSLSYSSLAVLPISEIYRLNYGSLVNLIWSRVQASKLLYAI